MHRVGPVTMPSKTNWQSIQSVVGGKLYLKPMAAPKTSARLSPNGRGQRRRHRADRNVGDRIEGDDGPPRPLALEVRRELRPIAEGVAGEHLVVARRDVPREVHNDFQGDAKATRVSHQQTLVQHHFGAGHRAKLMSLERHAR